MAKLTITCPECGGMFDKGLVCEVGEDQLDEIDIAEFIGMTFICVSCGYEVKTGHIELKDEEGLPIC